MGTDRGRNTARQIGLEIKSIRTRPDLLPYEAENIRKAVVKYLAARPTAKSALFDYGWMLKFHKEMFGDVWEWAGKQRTRDQSLGTRWQNVGQQLAELSSNIDTFPNDADRLLDQAVAIHHQSVRIHPFYNGNGRWARMLANIWLRRHGKAAIEWPEAEVGMEASSIRKDYIAAIKAADKYEFGPLTELHRRYWPNR